MQRRLAVAEMRRGTVGVVVVTALATLALNRLIDTMVLSDSYSETALGDAAIARQRSTRVHAAASASVDSAAVVPSSPSGVPSEDTGAVPPVGIVNLDATGVHGDADGGRRRSAWFAQGGRAMQPPPTNTASAPPTTQYKCHRMEPWGKP